MLHLKWNKYMYSGIEKRSEDSECKQHEHLLSFFVLNNINILYITHDYRK